MKRKQKPYAAAATADEAAWTRWRALVRRWWADRAKPLPFLGPAPTASTAVVRAACERLEEALGQGRPPAPEQAGGAAAVSALGAPGQGCRDVRDA